MTQNEREKEIALKREAKKMTKVEIFCIWSGAIHGKGKK
jgi:hypothetical protein